AKVKKDCHRYQLRVADGMWDELWLAETRLSREYFGQSFADIAFMMRKSDPMDAYLDILMNEGEHITSAMMFGVVKDEAHLREMLNHSLYAPEADSPGSLPLSGPLYENAYHPASFGWTAFIIGTCARDKGWLTVEQAVHKITGWPANKFLLLYRGLLRPGLNA